MMFLRLSAVLAAATAAVAYPEWIPASQIPGAVRAPCPGLNSMANHGFLPRDGKGITVVKLVEACAEAINVGPDFCTVLGTAALLSKGAQEKGGLVFDLDDLNQHNFPTEHDASVSRQDAYFGDNHTFNETIFQTVKDSVGPLNVHTMESAGDVRRIRLQDSVTRNPEVTYQVQHAILSHGEAALYLSIMGDPVTGIAPVSFVNSFFEQEKLPYDLGWTPSLLQTNFATLAVMIAQIVLYANDEVLEGIEILESTVKLAFGALGTLKLK